MRFENYELLIVKSKIEKNFVKTNKTARTKKFLLDYDAVDRSQKTIEMNFWDEFVIIPVSHTGHQDSWLLEHLRKWEKLSLSVRVLLRGVFP